MRLNRLAVASSALIFLAACNNPATEPAATEPASAPPAAEPAPAPAADPNALTPTGLGPIQVGMTEEAVRAALGPDRIEGDTGTDFETCKEMKLKGDMIGTWVMFLDGKVSRVTIGDESKAKTDKGLGIGVTAAQVKAAYPTGLKVEPHKYEGPDAQYLVWWATPQVAGLKYETNSAGVVKSIHGGGESIEYVEGCA